MTTETDYGECYLINSRSYIKKVRKVFSDTQHLTNEDGSIKPNVFNLKEITYNYGGHGYECFIPTVFIELEYKITDHGNNFIEQDYSLYDDEFPTIKDLENYKEKFSYGFVDCNQSQLDIINAFHNGCGHTSLSDDEGYDYE